MTNHLLRRARSVSAQLLPARFSQALVGMGSLLLAFSLPFSTSAAAQAPSQVSSQVSSAAPQVTRAVDNTARIRIPGTVHPLAQSRFDRGAVAPSLQAPRLQLMLNRPADREAALKQFIASANIKGSANYHKWLTPDQFGKQFGPADSDISAVTAWLQSQGLTINKVSRSKSLIDFGGTAAQIQSAFGTSIHKYVVNGESHYANASDITVPSALAPAIKGVAALNDFKLKPQVKVLGTGTYDPKTHKGTASWSYPEGTNGEFFYVAPSDFAAEYDTQPLLNAGTNGTGVTIGIINDSNIDISLVNAYRSLYGLPANTPQVIVDGNDPGVNGDAVEAYLDVETAGGVAPGATINLYVAESTTLSQGLDLATARAVDDDAAQILNLSFGNCEQYLQENAFYAFEWEQAAAQGQTVTVSSGDAGSEQCSVNKDSAGNPIYGLSVNGAASTPYNIAVGGTDFYYSDYASTPSGSAPPSFTTYWDVTTSSTPATSITQYIPEQPWNNSQYGLNIATAGGATPDASPSGAGGGVSSCSSQDTNGVCLGGYALPGFQSSVVPSGTTTRALPDVSLFSANGFNYSSYAICAAPGDCNTYGQSASPQQVSGVGGTSASAPAFAAIMALVVQKYGPQGQADVVLYPLAKQFPSAFHDVTAGNINEPCDPSAGITELSPCTKDTNSNPATYSVQDYSAGTGYDLASGLGSVDANNLVTNWNNVTFTSTTTTLTINPTTITHGAAVTLTANVASTSATGDVSFTTSTPLPNNKGLGFGTLTNGVATVTAPSSTVTDLPGGTYNITAQYEGDGSYAPSTSTAQSIIVNPEASTTYVTAFEYYQGAVIPTGTTNVPYGSSIAIEAEPVGSAVTQTVSTVGSINTDGAATGNVLFTDGGTTATIALNAAGIASWNPGTFPVGTHSITAKYSGDASFNTSTSAAPVTFTVIKGTPVVNVVPTLASQQTGGNLTVQVFLCNPEVSNSTTFCGFGPGTAPTGSVTVTLGGQTQTGTLSAITQTSGYGGIANVGAGNYSVATVTFPSVPAGATTISAAYAGDGNWNSATGSSSFATSAGSLVNTTTTLTASPVSGNNNASTISFTATITGTGSTVPTGTVNIYDAGTSLGTIDLSNGTPTTNAVTVTFSLPAYGLSQNGTNGGTNQYVAVYSGDSHYAPSTSPVATFTVDQSDFTLSTQNGAVSVSAGGTGTAILNLNSLAGFNAAVNLTCASGNSALTCTVAPGTVNLNGTATATVTINASSSAAMHEPLKNYWFAGGSLALACLVFFGIPARQRGWRSMLSVMFCILLTANFGCGGSSSHSSNPPPTTVATPTFSPAAGTYSSAQTVTIATTTSGATIYYTTDGSTPSTSSTKYSAPITVSKTETVNAIATASGDTTSAVGTAAYTITPGSPRSFGPPPTAANTIYVTATSTGANPEIHTIAIPIAIQ